MAGLVADYSSSSDDEKDDDELAEEISNRIAQKRPINFFESPPDTEESKKKKNAAPVESEAKAQESQQVSLANPLREENSLPAPFSDDNSTSVFFNPFQKAQEDKKLVLEKHVKMTENPKDVLEINGRKICWNYRKGRCKFGHNCKYAHDSDVIQQSDQISESKEHIQPSSVANPLSGWSYGELANFHTIESEPVVSELDGKKKKRPGLSEGIVPNKKVLKMYQKQQAKETPWKLKN